MQESDNEKALWYTSSRFRKNGEEGDFRESNQLVAYCEIPTDPTAPWSVNSINVCQTSG